MTSPDPRRARRIGIHLIRVLLLVAVILLIRVQHSRMLAQQNARPLVPIDVTLLQSIFPGAESVSDHQSENGRRDVFDGNRNRLGYLLQTSPLSDHLIGFSGPTNCLLAFSNDDRIAKVNVMSSGDTRDHVKQIVEDQTFLGSFLGLTWEQAAASNSVDSVSGATLTSLAIRESIVFRLSGGRPSLRFPDPLSIDDAKPIFPAANSISQAGAVWKITDNAGNSVGSILRTSPHADNLIGYQGPTETLIGVDANGTVVAIRLGKSYDNQPYVDYVRDDQHFLSSFNGRTLEQLAGLNCDDLKIEGVSGATMTSMTVTEGVLLAVKEISRQTKLAQDSRLMSDRFLPATGIRLRDLGTLAVILAGTLIGFTSLRGKKPVRICFQLVLIGYLGLINGDMISQAMLVGWAQSGIPWGKATGLILLTIAAIVIPMTTRTNIYCSHLCPHGAVQQLIKDRLPWRIRLTRRWNRLLKWIPVLSLAWCIIVAMGSLSFNLVDIEPFDAWVFRVAGWATISVAAFGLSASLFVPMAYCRYGCPTGALLNFLRYNSQSDRWSLRDSAAIGLVALAVGLLFKS